MTSNTDNITSKALICSEISEDIDVLSLQTVVTPPPGPAEVRIAIKACGVNFPDILMIQGRYQFKPPLPFAPGGEASGLVEAVGADVDSSNVGDEVMFGARCGGFAEHLNVSASEVFAKPPAMSFEQAATWHTAYQTAYVALAVRGSLQAGETLLVHGAGGGVGMAAVDVGKALGATVIATAGTDEKLAVVKARGADHVINYTQADGSLGGFRDEVKALTDGRGADVVYDPVGGDVFDESMRCVNWEGRLLTIGFTSGRWPQAAVNLILIKSLSVIGVRAGEYGRRNPAGGAQVTAALLGMAERGEVDPYVCARIPLAQGLDALKMMQERRVIGKVAIVME